MNRYMNKLENIKKRDMKKKINRCIDKLEKIKKKKGNIRKMDK